LSSFLILIFTSIVLLIISIKYPEILLVYVIFFFPFTEILLDNFGLDISRLMVKFIIIFIAILVNKNSFNHIKINIKRFTTSKFIRGYSLIIVTALVQILFLQGNKDQYTTLLRDVVIYNAIPCILFVVYCNNDRILYQINQQIILMSVFSIIIVYYYFDTSQIIIGQRSTIGQSGIDNISLSQFGVLCFFICIITIYYNRYKIMRFISVMVATVSLFIMLIAAERGPVVGLLVALISFVITKTKIGKSYKPLIILFTFIILTYIMKPERFGIIDRFYDLENYQSYERYDYILISIDMFFKKPILGYGILGFSSQTGMQYPHNIILEFMVEYGIIGLLALYLMLSDCIKVVYKCLRNQNANYYEIALSLCWIALFISSLFSGNISGNRYFYAVSGIISAIAVNKKMTITVPNSIAIKV
jgi:O-antigen ligase